MLITRGVFLLGLSWSLRLAAVQRHNHYDNRYDYYQADGQSDRSYDAIMIFQCRLDEIIIGQASSAPICSSLILLFWSTRPHHYPLVIAVFKAKVRRVVFDKRSVCVSMDSFTV